MIKPKRILRLPLFLCLLPLLLFFYSSSSASSLTFDAGGLSQVFPGPDLLYPITDDIDLKGAEYLEFKWRRSAFPNTRGYEFRLYKGYQAIASNLILKRNLTVEEYPFKVESLVFDVGQVYTWVLCQINMDGKKSDKSFSSFKVINK